VKIERKLLRSRALTTATVHSCGSWNYAHLSHSLFFPRSFPICALGGSASGNTENEFGGLQLHRSSAVTFFGRNATLDAAYCYRRSVVSLVVTSELTNVWPVRRRVRDVQSRNNRELSFTFNSLSFQCSQFSFLPILISTSKSYSHISMGFQLGYFHSHSISRHAHQNCEA